MVRAARVRYGGTTNNPSLTANPRSGPTRLWRQGVCTAIYAVTKQESGTTQRLVCAKSRLAKRNLTIPRLELVAGHMAVNLVANVRAALGNYPTKVHCWLDSTVALYWIRVGAWVRRFIHNCKTTAVNRGSGPLTTIEIENQKTWWIIRAQRDAQNKDHYVKDQLQLNLQLNQQQVLECRGRLQGEYPIYLPDDHLFTSKLVLQAHLTTLHGGVGLTMAKVRERYWVPRLRRLVKKIRAKCWGCVRFRTKAFQSPPPGNLPVTRTQGNTLYQVIGVDFAGPIRYRTKSKAEKKAYLVLYGCSLTRGVYLDLLPSLETESFVCSRGRPKRATQANLFGQW